MNIPDTRQKKEQEFKNRLAELKKEGLKKEIIIIEIATYNLCAPDSVYGIKIKKLCQEK